MESLTDHASLISALGGGAKVAELLSHLEEPPAPKDVTVRAWAARNRIPPEYWPELIRLGREAGREVTAEWLMNTMQHRQRPTAEAEAEAA
ncbi:MAG TPA: hypothetical protein VFW19_10735 [Allosphingosinicella sp.]|nr:hypothetical protein [Allosphingosinicella sp.]